MATKNDYIEKAENEIKKYKEKISKIEVMLKEYDAPNAEQLLGYKESLEDKFHAAEDMLEKLKASTEEEYEELQDTASEVFTGIRQAFHDFSNFLTLEQLYHAKDEIIDFGKDKLEDAQELLKKHPLASAASALTLGFVIGSLFTRSSK